MQDNKYFVLKRLHSLSGVVPTAGFVIFHLFENSNSVAGPEAFNHTVAMLRGLPYLYLLEIGLLAPILFHAGLGIYIARTAKYNNQGYGYRANWMYLFQRVTGFGLLIFIAAHLYTTRFADIPSDQMFQRLATDYQNPVFFIGYVLGIFAAAFHLANGLWGFAAAWGIVTGQKSMDLLWKLCMGLGVAVFLMGMNALLGFSGRGIDIFQHSKRPAAEAVAPAPVTTPVAAPKVK